MRCPIFFIIATILTLGLLTNESMSQSPPGAFVPWNPFNVVTDETVRRRAEVLFLGIYKTAGAYLREDFPMLQAWLRMQPEAMIEAFNLNIRLTDVIRAFNRIAPPEAIPLILFLLSRVRVNYGNIGAISVAINRPMATMAGLAGNALQLRAEQMVTGCFSSIGYTIVGAARDPQLQLTAEEAWPMIISWMMQFNFAK